MVTPLITMLGLVGPTLLAATDPSPLLYLIGSGGLVAILTLVITTGRDLLKGRVQVRETRDANLVTQRDTAWAERDEAFTRYRCEARRASCEARNARRLWDYAARLRRKLISLGVPDGEIPAEPELDDCTVRDEP